VHYQKCIPFGLKCPITDVKFVELSLHADKVRPSLANDSSLDWQYLKFNEKWALGVSTTQPYDPLIHLKLYENHPCLNVVDGRGEVHSSVIADHKRPSFMLER